MPRPRSRSTTATSRPEHIDCAQCRARRDLDALLAFLDDDEYAAPDWLANLDRAPARRRSGVRPLRGHLSETTRLPGSSRAIFIPIALPQDDRSIDTGYTSNVLIDMGFVRRNGLKFDPLLGETGGEDTMFFHALYKRGGTLRYAPDGNRP